MKMTVLGIDLAKNVGQLPGVDDKEHVVLRVTFHIQWRCFGSWPLLVNETTCPNQIQQREYSTQSFSVSSNGFILQCLVLSYLKTRPGPM
jgi:hypothetical protein